MIRYQVFRRKFMTWMQAGFNKIGNINDLQELPYGCILHVLDNFPMDGRVDWGPRITNYFMHMNNFKVFMHNVTSWPEHKSSDVAPIYKDKMIMTSAGVMQGTMKYMRDMMPRVKFSSDMKGLPVRPSTMSVVNYNPLFRARCLGVRKKVRFFNFLLAYMCNKIMEDKERQHFIHIPLEPFIYEKKDFIRVFRKFDRIATLYPERSSYLFLAHFYGLLSRNISLPKRGTIPEDEKDEGETASTEALEAMVAGLPEEGDLESADFMDALRQFSQGLDVGLEGLKEGENPYTNSMFEYLHPAMFEKINFIFTAGEYFVCYNLRDIKELNGRANVGILRIINQLNMLIREGFANAQPDELVKDETVPEEIQTISDAKLDKGNTTTFTTPLSKQDKIDAAEVDMLELDNVDRIIADLPSKPTPKQEEKIRHLSKAYKTLTIDGLRFDKLLAEPTEDIITPPTVKTQSTENGTMTSEATRSTTAELGKVYLDTQMTKDIAAICTSFNKQGMFLVDFKEEEVADELSVWKNYTASYEDTNHKTHKIKFSIPKFDSMGRCKVNGTMKAMKIQRVSRPICKVSPTRVTINSNYNKALIERNTNSSHNFIDWFSRKALFKINNGGFALVPTLGVCKFPMKALPYEYTALGSKYHKLTYGDKSLAGGLFFDYDQRAMQYSEQVYDGSIAPLENSGLGVWFGWKQSKPDYDNGKVGQHFFIDVTGLITVKDFDADEEPFCGAFGDFIEWLTGISLIPPVEHIDITYLSKTVPLIHVLAYRYGLTNMLKYCKCDYMVRDRNERVETRPSDIIIKFKDKKLIITRTPRANALLFGGLAVFDLDEVFLEDMDNKDVYYTLLEQVRVRMGFIKGVDSFFDLFIDPITRDVLRDMRAPTDMRDLLLYTVTLLTTSEHLPASSESNFRYRNIEQVTAIVYNEMARAFAGYKNKSVGAGTRFSISEYTIRQRIVQDQNMEKVDTINPIADIKAYSNITNAGTNGRTSDTFLLADRMFTKDALGIVSEATVDNGKVGMNAILPANPKLVDARGMTESIDPSKLEPENILSMNSLVMPCIVQDDGKRSSTHILCVHNAFKE